MYSSLRYLTERFFYSVLYANRVHFSGVEPASSSISLSRGVPDELPTRTRSIALLGHNESYGIKVTVLYCMENSAGCSALTSSGMISVERRERARERERERERGGSAARPFETLWTENAGRREGAK